MVAPSIMSVMGFLLSRNTMFWAPRDEIPVTVRSGISNTGCGKSGCDPPGIDVGVDIEFMCVFLERCGWTLDGGDVSGVRGPIGVSFDRAFDDCCETAGFLATCR